MSKFSTASEIEAVDRIRNQRAIGEIVRIEAHMLNYGQPGDWWRSSKSISGGILYDWGVHLVDGAELIITPEWSRRPIHILDLAVQSAKAGKTLSAKHG